MKTYLIPLALLVAGCGNRQVSHNSIDLIDVAKVADETEQVFRKIKDPADTAWINTLNKIKFSAEQEIPINVYFKYNQIVNGYEVTGRWMPFDPYCETGGVVMNFRHKASGRSFQYTERKYYNFDLGKITFSNGFNDHHQDGDVYYLDYIDDNPEGYKDSPFYYSAPFQFYDVDFDGEKELIINECDQIKGGNTYHAYKIGEKGIEPMDYVPFKDLYNDVTFDVHNKTIRLYCFDGVFDSSYILFSKHPAIINCKEFPEGLSEGWTTSKSVLENYYKQDKTNFRLDSIYQYFHYPEQDSVFIYAMTNRGLALVAKRNYPH